MEKLKQQLKELYMQCFPEDSETYTQFFLDNKFDGTNCFTLYDYDGKLIDMLFLIKKQMVLRGTVFDVSYLVAGGTVPEHRGKHIFTGELYRAIKLFHDTDRPITGLMPFAHSFYVKQAFVTHSFYKENPVKKGKLPLKEISFGQIDEMSKVYNDFMKDKNGWFYRDKAAFDLRLREIFCEGGKAYGLYRDGKMQGYILTCDNEEIDEYCAITPSVIDDYDTPFESVKENIPPCDDAEEDNMIRICNNKLLMERIQYPKVNQTVAFCVDDWFFKENSGCYELTVKDGKGVVKEVKEAKIRLSIEDFTRLVCGCYRNGDFDENLERVFPVMLNCALDKF